MNLVDILNNGIPWWIWFVFGAALGALIDYRIWSGRKEGMIYVTPKPDEDRDIYLFEFNIPPEKIPSMRQVVFRVVIKPEPK